MKQFRILERDLRTGAMQMLKDVYTTDAKAQAAVEQLNKKSKKFITYIKTIDLQNFKKTQIQQALAKAE